MKTGGWFVKMVNIISGNKKGSHCCNLPKSIFFYFMFLYIQSNLMY